MAIVRHDTQHKKKTLIAENLNSWRKTVNPTIIWYLKIIGPAKTGPAGPLPKAMDEAKWRLGVL